jgi:hypothetical protein
LSHRVLGVDAGGGFVRKTNLSAATLLFAFGRARFQHQLQGTNALVCLSNASPSSIGLTSSRFHALAPENDLRFAPPEQPLQVTQQGNGQRQTAGRSLSRLHLAEDHSYARFSRQE